MGWRVTFVSETLAQDILELPAGFVARFLRYAERLETYGPNLGMPHTRAMGGGLYELRLKAAEGTARVFYCTTVGERIVVLHQFIKKSDKTPDRELALARKRMKELRNAERS